VASLDRLWDGYNMLSDIPENPHAEAIDLQDAPNEPDRQTVAKQDDVTAEVPGAQSAVPTIRHVRDFSTCTNFTIDSEFLAGSESDSLSARGTDPNQDDDSMKNEPRLSIWERLKDPKVAGIILAIILFLLIGVICGTQIFEAIVGAKQWFLDNPLVSVPWYCLLFSVASAVFMPYGPFCISVGYIWGLRWGFPVQLAAIAVSSAFIYVVGRVLLKKRVNEHTQKYRLWRAIMDHMGRDWKEAAKINLLMCFIPMPYGTHAYLFSLSECTFFNFVWVFELGMIGHTFLNLAVGDALAMSAELGTESTSTLQFVATIVGVVAMIVSIWYGGIVTQRIMDQEYNEDKILVKHDACSNDAVTAYPDVECGGSAGVELTAQTNTTQAAAQSSVIELVLEAGPELQEEPQRRSPAACSVRSPHRAPIAAPTALAPAALA